MPRPGSTWNTEASTPARRAVNAIATLVLALSMLVLLSAWWGDPPEDQGCETDTGCQEMFGGDGGPAPAPGPRS